MTNLKDALFGLVSVVPSVTHKLVKLVSPSNASRPSIEPRVGVRLKDLRKVQTMKTHNSVIVLNLQVLETGKVAECTCFKPLQWVTIKCPEGNKA